MLSLPHATLYFGICVYGVFVSTVAVLVYVCKHAGLGSLSKLACLALRGFGLWSASVWVASGTRVRRARVMDEATRFAAWTKEGRGDMPPPEEALAKELLELFKNGDIVTSSVVTKATVIPKDDLRELWSAVWTDVDVMRQAAGDKPMPSSRRQRYVLWALLPSTVFDVTRDGSTPDKKRPPDATPSAPAEAGGFGR